MMLDCEALCSKVVNIEVSVNNDVDTFRSRHDGQWFPSLKFPVFSFTNP